MKFTKMHGAGNDYVYINCLGEDIQNKSELSIFLSNRNFGVGSDGLICICPSKVADFKMDMYNADGSRSQMCGNGIRCVGKYVYDKGLTSKTQLTIETGAGIKELFLNIKDGLVNTVRVNMGKPIFLPSEIPVLHSGKDFINKPIEICGNIYTVTAVSVGNPHVVTFVDNVDDVNLEKLGPLFENHKIFPERINTEFVQVIDNKTLKMRVWERGSGETLACGTGATASLVAANICGHCGTSADVLLKGGRLKVDWDKENDTLYMTGGAVTVFEGELKTYCFPEC